MGSVTLGAVVVAVLAFGGVALALWAFYVIGRGEDRDRHRDDGEGDGPSGTPEP